MWELRLLSIPKKIWSAMGRFVKLDTLLESGVNESVYTAASVLLSKKNKIEYSKVVGGELSDFEDRIDENTYFDLASLTKPIATTIFFLLLWQDRKILPQTGLYKLTGIKKFKNIDVSNLLLHDSGLPAHRHYYEKLSKLSHDKRECARLGMIANENLMARPGEKTIYSDIGFMVLKNILEKSADMEMSEYLKYNFYDKIDADLFFASRIKKSIKNYCPTSFSLFRNKRLRGEVHDDNAYAIGGVDGHAGLFGNSYGIYKVLNELYSAYIGNKSLLNSELTKKLFIKKSEKRFLGFDVVSGKNSSAGSLFCKNTAGHLGFTGTSFWIDFDRGISIILLTNRVYYGDNNLKIRSFRPRLHDLVNNLL